MPELTAEQTFSLSSLSGIIGTINGLLATGITAAEAAEKVLKFLDPAVVPALDTFIKVLQEVQSLAGKV
jgi:hypothetical protein